VVDRSRVLHAGVVTMPIPAALALPVLGSAPWLLHDPLAFLRREYRRLGAVFRISAPGRQLVVLAGPKANKFASSGPGRDALAAGPFWKPVAERMGCPHLLLAMDGEAHMAQRRAYRDDLSRHVVVDHWNDVAETVERVTARTFPTDRPVSAREYCRVLVSSVISRMLTHRDLLGDADTLDAVLEYFRWQTNALLLGKWPRWVLELPQFRRYERTTAEFLRRHRRALTGRTPPGWFASMEALRRERPELLEDGDIDAHHMLPYVVGVDTVGVTLTFLLQELLGDSGRLWRQLRDEVDAAWASADGALPSYDTLRELPLLNGAWREALRLYPAAFGIYRTAATTFTFDDATVRAGEDVLLFTSAAHTDPEHFPRPHHFDPTRGAAAYRKGNVFAPYGRGPHVCLGAGMAEALLPLVLAVWVRHYTFSQARPGKRYRMAFDPSPTLPDRFRVRQSRRAAAQS